jgi:hypothetical protein
MLQGHRTVTPRIARMLCELERPDTGQNRAADVAKPATDRGGHHRNRTARLGFIAAAALIAAAFVAVIAWPPRAVEVAEGAVTTTGASTDVDHVPLQVTATPRSSTAP